VDVTALLPPDPLSAGFDNIADAQSFSPAVMEGYIRAAGKVAAEALGDPAASATSATYTVPSKGARVDLVGANGVTVADIANDPRERIQPFPETVELLVRLGAKNSDRCVSC
jgi:hypothetical protein